MFYTLFLHFSNNYTLIWCHWHIYVFNIALFRLRDENGYIYFTVLGNMYILKDIFLISHIDYFTKYNLYRDELNCSAAQPLIMMRQLYIFDI